MRRALNWIEDRTGLQKFLKHVLSEPIPGGARLAYVFGSGLLIIFFSQVITGVALALYYCPSPDHAHTTVAYMVKEVSSGVFLRGLHAYGASAMVILLCLHIVQTFTFGSYKGRRELLWISGSILAVLVLGMAFTGYLLPWDQKAYFATTVGTNIASEIPWIGDGIRKLIRGGNEVGGLTLSRFFVMHVFLLPGAIFGFIALHLILFRKAGPAGPIHADPLKPLLKSEPFYPKQVFYDLIFALLIMGALALFAIKAPSSLGPIANPADTLYLPRPEWYFRPVFQWYRYFRGSGVVVGVIIIPAILGLLFILAPFLDRGRSRTFRARKFPLTVFSLLFFGAVALGVLSFLEDVKDPSVAEQLKKQEEAEKVFLHAPFEPIIVGSMSKMGTPVTNPAFARGKGVFEAKNCSGCHGENGIGTVDGVSLIGIAKKYSDDGVREIILHPTVPMKQGGMRPIEASPEELDALIKYIRSLQ